MFFHRHDAAAILAGFMFLWWIGNACAESKTMIRIYFPDGEFVLAEVALTAEQRQNGLMFRDGMAQDQSMLFVFEEEAVHSFWMKNMRFSIDILWLDREKRIVHLAKQVPPCRKEPCSSYSPVLPSIYVLELTAGKSDALKLKPDDRLEFLLPKESYKKDRR